MDLVEQRKLVEQQIKEHLTSSVLDGGKSLVVAWKFKREFSFKNPTFWKYIIQLSNELFLAQFNDTRCLDKTFKCVFGRATLLPASLLRAKLCSIKNFFDTAFTRLRKTQIDYRAYIIQRLSPSRPNSSCTGAPKGFVPLPDVEIGGCARNDSLIALANN